MPRNKISKKTNNTIQKGSISMKKSRKINKVVLSAILMSTLGTSIQAADFNGFIPMKPVSFNKTDLSAVEYNDRSYIDASSVTQVDIGSLISKERMCIPYEGKLVLAIVQDGKVYIPVRALANENVIAYENNQVTLTPLNSPTGMSTYAEINYNTVTNKLSQDARIFYNTYIWDVTSQSILKRESEITLGPNETKEIEDLPNMVGREIVIYDNFTGEIKSEVLGSGYMDVPIIKEYIKRKNMTIQDVFPEFYTEYKIKATGEIVKCIAKNGSTLTIRHDDGKEEQMAANKLTMQHKNRINKEIPSNEEIVEFVNTMKYTSPTDYLVYTDLNRQYTYVLKKQDKSWTVVKKLLSSTGLNTTPTPKGQYNLTKKVPYFGVEKGYRCKNAVGFIGGTYLYHSVIFDKTGTYLLEGKGVLGNQASQGCIRFTPEEAEWFYKTLPLKSTVIIR